MFNPNSNYYIEKVGNLQLKTPLDKISIVELVETIRFFQFKYYVENETLISDSQFDELFTILKNWEAKYPDKVLPNSPTQIVGSSLTNRFQQTTAHLVPMLSLENKYTEQELLDFDSRLIKLVENNQITYCLEPKFDGVSLSLVYQDDKLQRGVTRGNGIEGEDVTQSVYQIKSIPIQIPLSKFNIQMIEIRGEIMMFKDKFVEYNNYLAEMGLPLLSNPRNSAAGSLRIKDVNEVRRRKLDGFFYHISYIQYFNSEIHKPILSQFESLELLRNLGIKSSIKYAQKLDSISAVMEQVISIEKTRDNFPFEIDGLVIKIDNLVWQEKIGMTSHHPRWAVAYKFKARQAETQVNAVEFQIGKSGAITPVAKLKPVNLAGVTVSNISLHNADYIAEKDIKIGDKVLIERAGEVIPQIVCVVIAKRNGTEKPIEFPNQCPNCGQKLVRLENEVVWRCINSICSVQIIAKLIHFVSKNAMDISFLGEANIEKFYQLGFLKNIPDLYRLPYNKIKELEGFGEKSIAKLQQAVEQSKQQDLPRLLFGLSIKYIGETTAKSLAKTVDHILDFCQRTIEDLEQLEDIGIKTAQSLIQYFKIEENVLMLKELEQLGVNILNKNKNNLSTMTEGLPLLNQSFLFTGTLKNQKRNEAEEKVESLGGKILGSVSSKLNYLIVGAEPGSKLEKAKKLGKISILSELEFENLISKFSSIKD